MNSLAKIFTRVTAVMLKELRELARRPGAIASLMLGPLIVVALFGLGYSGQRRPLETVVVVPVDAALPQDVETYRKLGGEAIRVLAVTPDTNSAQEFLRRGEARLVVVLPADFKARLEHGEQAALIVEWNEMDPVRASIAYATALGLVQELNRQLLKTALVTLGIETVSIGSPGVQITAEVIASPLKLETRNIAPASPTFVAFFAPAILALVLQHLAITLTALSMIRERTSGAMDLYRVSPVHGLELLVGKYLAYGVLTLVIAGVLVTLLTVPLDIPLVGDRLALSRLVLLLTFASLGLGLLISLVADSERQAVQLAMLVLLASMFFSGFILPIEEFREPVRYVAYALPVTYGVALFQDLMLRGGGGVPAWYEVALLAIGVVLFVLTAMRLRATMRATA
jgi:ABC-2 type transport system permease protein